jgi:hypothetical protein
MNQEQFLNKAIKAATKIGLRSREDDLFLVAHSDVVKLERGMYGWWLLRPQGLDAAYGIWCFATQRVKADGEVVERVKDVKERVARIADLLGVKSEPRVALVDKWFKVVRVVKVEAAEKYAVYDFEPTKEWVTAVLAYVHYGVWWSRGGICRGEMCRVFEKYKLLLKAEFLGEDVEVDEAGVYVPYDVRQLAAAVAKLMSTAEAAEAVAVDVGGEAAVWSVRTR